MALLYSKFYSTGMSSQTRRKSKLSYLFLDNFHLLWRSLFLFKFTNGTLNFSSHYFNNFWCLNLRTDNTRKPPNVESFEKINVRWSKTVLNSGFQLRDSVLFEGGTWIPNSNCKWHCEFLELDFWSSKPRIPDSTSKKFPGFWPLDNLSRGEKWL